MIPTTSTFRGAGYKTHSDHDRLAGQHERIKALMGDGQWRTLGEIHDATGDPEASISAQLRFLRTARFGSHEVKKQRRDGAGLWEYRLVPDKPGQTAFWGKDFDRMLRNHEREEDFPRPV